MFSLKESTQFYRSNQPSRTINPPLDSQTGFPAEETVKVTSEGQAANLQKDWIYGQGMGTMSKKLRGKEASCRVGTDSQELVTEEPGG